MKSIILTAILLAQLSFHPCVVDSMMEQLLMMKFIRPHRESDTEYYLFKNEYSENCSHVKFGKKTLVPSSKEEGNVFKILKLDSLGTRAHIEVLLENENMVLKGNYNKIEGKWKLENSTYIVY
ncbi:hypothetical protein LZF95_21440 [Algoriphagus sp. AGSA1]|uniref:hypothetical protein n=1 Tax=Algoriphagus sp. AGSA1 TaxID=2907213 RepID=UPI001F2B222E|nr:hypothetical protein [Algoriphagus sp. AGSA1]MCE7057259.1 hypothetical protein [Algoriphagus sp. AGSA1]